MTTPDTDVREPRARTPLDWRQILDVLAILLIVAGVIGILIVCFAAHRLAGYGALSTLAVAVGVLLGYDR